jgi:hypothetical protein
MWSNNLASLQDLHIDNCEGLENIGGENALAKIKKVYIDNCLKLMEVEQPLFRDGGSNNAACV